MTPRTNYPDVRDCILIVDVLDGRPAPFAQVTNFKLPRLLARDFEAMLALVGWINGALGLPIVSRKRPSI
jgi:hypothetical protein